MRYLTIAEFGSFIGLSGNRVVVRNAEGEVFETALSQLRAIRIAKKGVAFSSDLLLACAARGIRVFLLDWRGVGVVALSGCHQHAVVALREKQFFARNNEREAFRLAQSMLEAKIFNQRAVLLYFGKSFKRDPAFNQDKLIEVGKRLDDLLDQLRSLQLSPTSEWKGQLLGIEGFAASVYWAYLREGHFLPEEFKERTGRGALDIVNAGLNYGYAVLQSYVWGALDNAGFELYGGFLHSDRPGKSSLILDVIEEYRAWVVDRNIIKIRKQLAQSSELNFKLKKRITEEIDKTMAGKIYWHGKSIKLENAMQRQVYRLAGAIVEGKKYTGIHFKW